MEQLMAALAEHLNDNFLHATVSKKRRGGIPDRVKIRPVCIKGENCFQTAVSDGKKEFHKNYRKEDLLQQIEVWLREDYKQIQMDAAGVSLQALVNKKGKAAVRLRENGLFKEAPAAQHNRQKHYLLEEGVPVPFLVDLGVMTSEGRIVKEHYRKFRQINRFLEFVEDVLPALEKGREITIVDFGCGKSYLTFAMYYYLHVKRGYDVRMTGLDLKQDVIEMCSALAEKYGYDKLTFQTGDIASYEGADSVDMVVTLHACDTATDYALQKAVQWKADVILSVPCCQHELNGQIASELMQPVLKYGLVKERMAALLTDAFRGNLLEEQGYQVQLMEFIDMEHTPKNILIRAVRKRSAKKEPNRQLSECMAAWNVKPLLDELLNGRAR
ncbi:MAG: SAM-dependent methyltransferase [Eubacteriales bacterium]|nr:SAM-dependent methyltransferase [Eubacteriales bacterium]